MTYHAGIKQIVYAPVEEMLTLRKGKVAELTNKALEPGTPMNLKVTEASDVEFEFALPSTSTTISVNVNDKLSAFIQYEPATTNGVYSVQVGFGDWNKATLLLLPEDKTLTLRLFLDGPAGEAYFQGGRVAQTVAIKEVSSIDISSSKATAQLLSAASFAM